jgi:tRNA threonylcarbamoyladenosine biosynthesis protein TsaB
VIVLALDTSHAVGSVALARDDDVLGEAHFDSPSSHMVELARAIERLLAENRVAIADVDRVAVVVGPGSFTGVRIAIAFAKGLAASGRDVVGVTSLHALALPLLAHHERVCAMIDAKRNEVYASVFERGPVEVVAARAASPADILAALNRPPDAFVGTGARVHSDAIRARFPKSELVVDERAFPSMRHLALAARALEPYPADAVRALEPVYLRPSGAERKRLRTHESETP